MTTKDISRHDAIKDFGVDPNAVGIRNRGYWVIETLDEDDMEAGAQVGDLCVKTRDPGGGQFDAESMKCENFVGLSIDSFDPTYAYYYYRKVGEPS